MCTHYKEAVVVASGDWARRFWDQNAGQNHSTTTDNSYFEREEEFKYFETTLKNQNFIQKEIKSNLKSGNICYHLMQKLLSSSLLIWKFKE